MPLHVDVIDDTNEIAAETIAGVVSAAFANLDDALQGDWACVVRVASTEEIALLHGRFFGEPSDTDVMSFPSGEDLTACSGYLGDIAISIDMAKVQAVEAEHSITREISYLALHGMLHLLGYDDLNDVDRIEMLRLQDILLSAAERAQGVRL